MTELRLAVRQLLKNPGYTAVSVLILALGIGANTALFSVVNGVLLRPLPFPEQERLVTLWESNPPQGIEQQAVSPPNFSDWQAQNSVFETMAYWTGPSDYNRVTPGGLEKTRASFASSELFRLLRVQPQLGRSLLPEDDRKEGPLNAVLSHQFWQEQFGGASNIVGRTFTVDTFGRRTFSVVGVMPPQFSFPEDTEVWLAAGWNGLPLNRRTGPWLNVLARLKPAVTLAQAQAEMNAIQARIAQAHPEQRLGREVSVVPLLRQTVGRSTRTALLVLWVVVAVVLLIACVNVANLMLARTAARQKEIAVRLALGAGRGRLIRQLLTESVVLALLGGAVGTLLGYWGVRAFVATSPANIPRLAEISVDGMALCFTVGAALLTGVVFGLIPAWQCSRPDLNDSLKEGHRGVAGGVLAGRTRGVLVIAETALATVLLVGAGLMLQSFGQLLNADRGVRAERVLTVDLDFSVAGFTTWIRPTHPAAARRGLRGRGSQLFPARQPAAHPDLFHPRPPPAGERTSHCRAQRHHTGLSPDARHSPDPRARLYRG
jgi:putative ABC transport system permease protein